MLVPFVRVAPPMNDTGYGDLTVSRLCVKISYVNRIPSDRKAAIGRAPDGLRQRDSHGAWSRGWRVTCWRSGRCCTVEVVVGPAPREDGASLRRPKVLMGRAWTV